MSKGNHVARRRAREQAQAEAAAAEAAASWVPAYGYEFDFLEDLEEVAYREIGESRWCWERQTGFDKEVGTMRTTYLLLTPDPLPEGACA